METQGIVYPRWIGHHRVDQRGAHLRRIDDAGLVAQHPHPPFRQRHQHFPTRPRLCFQAVLLPDHLPYVGVVGGEIL